MYILELMYALERRSNWWRTNFNKDDISLSPSNKIGLCYDTVTMGQTINMLSHKPQDDISEDELTERRNCIVVSLKLDQNPETVDSITLSCDTRLQHMHIR